MRAFVTGATGFVGTHVVRALLREGVQVRVLVRKGSDRRNLADLEVEIAEGDLRERERLPELLAGCDELYHVAAFYSTRPEDAAAMYEVNVRGTKDLLMAALESGVRRVVHTSTIGTIGRREDGGLPTEETAFNLWETASDYVKSKYLGEVAALAMLNYGLDVRVVHPCAPVGARDIKPTSSGQRLVDYLRGKRPSYPPGGLNWIAVEDVAQGHLLAARRGQPGARYILGNAQGNLSLEEFLALMAKLTGKRLPSAGGNPLGRLKRRLLGGTGETVVGHRPEALTADPSRAIRELGLPQTPLEEAFREAIRWFRDNGYVEG